MLIINKQNHFVCRLNGSVEVYSDCMSKCSGNYNSTSTSTSTSDGTSTS